MPMWSAFVGLLQAALAMSLQPAFLLGALVTSGVVGVGLLSGDDRVGAGFLLGVALGPTGVGVDLRWR